MTYVIAALLVLTNAAWIFNHKTMNNPFNFFRRKSIKEVPEIPEEETPPRPGEERRFQNLSLFDKYMFAKSYIRLLKCQLDKSRRRNRELQDELTHLKTLFRKDKRLTKK